VVVQVADPWSRDQAPGVGGATDRETAEHAAEASGSAVVA